MPPTVFVSYSHSDEVWKDRLVRHLEVLAFEGTLEVWDDRRIDAGDEWRPEIEAAIAQAAVAVLIVSPDFLTSRFIRESELTRILERRSETRLRVIPLIARPCAWRAVAALQGIQARPRDGRPLSAGTEYQVDVDLATLALEIRDLLVKPTSPGSDEVEHGYGLASDQPPTPRGFQSVRTLASLCVPAMVAGLVAVGSTYWHIPTTVSIELFTRRLSFNVAGDERPSLLNANRQFSALKVENCGNVSFQAERFRFTDAGENPQLYSGPISIVCGDSAANIRLTAIDDAPKSIGTLDQVRVPRGATVVIDVSSSAHPAITLDMSELPPITLAIHAPVTLTADLAQVLEPPHRPDSVVPYWTELAATNRLMQFDTHGRGAVLVITPTDQDALEFFNTEMRIPVEGVQFLNEAINERKLVSPLLRQGTLAYPDLPAKPPETVEVGRFFTPGGRSKMRLTQARLTDDRQGLNVKFEGELERGGVGLPADAIEGDSRPDWKDVRLTAYDSLKYGPRWRLLAGVITWALATTWIGHERWRKISG